MKKVNVSLSLPLDKHKKLQNELKKAYIQAEADQDRQKVIKDWSSLNAEDWH